MNSRIIGIGKSDLEIEPGPPGHPWISKLCSEHARVYDAFCGTYSHTSRHIRGQKSFYLRRAVNRQSSELEIFVVG